MDKKLAQLEFDKFTRKDTTEGVAPIAVTNPDGTSINSNVSLSGEVEIKNDIGNPVPVSAVSLVPISLASLPLPISLASLPVPITHQSNVTLNSSNSWIGLVSLASIQGKVEIISTPSSMITGVSSATSSTTILASNTLRKGGYIFNDSTAICYVKLGASASITSYTLQIASKGYYELPPPVYNGAISAIWAAVNGSVLVTEII